MSGRAVPTRMGCSRFHLPSLRFLGLFTLLWSTLLLPVLAQDRPLNNQFIWKFANEGLAGNLPTCVPLGIIVLSRDLTLNNTFGIEPFYMISYEVNGTPQTQFIGTDNRTLSYTVRHPPGSQLMLNVVDSTQSSGGIPPRLFNVVAGAATDCVVPNATAPTFTFTTNHTGTDLETCEPWGIFIKGGQPPYNISLAAVDSPVITNVTLLAGFDAFTYINRADPGTQLLAAVSDNAGRWATGTPIVMTKGNTNTTCPGLDSSSGLASELIKENEERQRRKSGSNTALIAGVTIPLVLLLLGGIGVGLWFFKRKKRAHEEEKFILGSEVTPFNASGGPSNTTPFDGSVSTASAKHMEAMGLGSSTNSRLSYPPSSSNTAIQSSSWNPVISGPVDNISTDTSSASPSSQRTRPSFAAFPRTSTRSLRGKAAEAAAEAANANAPSSSPAVSPVVSPDSEYAVGAEEIVIQHRDGGVPLIRELPPPYAAPSSR